MQKIDVKIELWKKKLLDMGKRNKLINYKKTKRSNISILEPSISELYRVLVEKGNSLTFDYAIEYGNKTINDEEEYFQDIIKGDITVDRNISEQQKTLRSLRQKAKTAMDEQGINMLFLACGFLKWKETPDSKDYITSPIILIPVSLSVASISDPFVIEMIDDEVAVNPTLINKLSKDFNIELPIFDYQNDDIMSYLKQIDERVIKNYWEVDYSSSVGMFSFLKINMYNDLDSKASKIRNNDILRCIAGEKTEFDSCCGDISQYENYDFDNKQSPRDSLLILDADSSQQDAVLFAQKGISFVLQGPPGTGKSQTISNIIAESIGNGKKVLFVSEKMAALEVVYKRLAQAGLGDFCFKLHSHKANKKAVLAELGNMLDLQKFNVSDETLRDLDYLEKDRRLLNLYAQELHTKVFPLNKTIYEVNGHIAKLANTKEIIFSIPNIGGITAEQYSEIIYHLNSLAHKIEAMSGKYKENPWYGFNKKSLSHELRHDIENKLKNTAENLEQYQKEVYDVFSKTGTPVQFGYFQIKNLIDLFEHLSIEHATVQCWLSGDISIIEQQAQNLKLQKDIRDKNLFILKESFDERLFAIKASKVVSNVNSIISKIACDTKLCYDRNNIIDLTSFENDKENIAKIVQSLAIGEQCTVEANDLFDFHFGTKIKDIVDLSKICDILVECTTFENSWFDIKNIEVIKKYLDDVITKQDELRKTKAFIYEYYDSTILDVNYGEKLLDLKTKYVGSFRGLKYGYRQIKSLVARLIKNKKTKISYNLICDLFEKIRYYNELLTWFNTNSMQIQEKLGVESINEFTELGAVKTNFDACILLQKALSFNIPKKFREYITLSKSFDKFVDIKEKVGKIESYFNNELIDYICFDSFEKLSSLESKIIINKLSNTFSLFDGILYEFNDLNSYTKYILSCQESYKILLKLKQIQDYNEEIENGKTNFEEKYEHLFVGQESNWDAIIKEIEWTKAYKEKVTRLNFDSKTLVGFANSNLNYRKIASLSQQILETTSSDVQWFIDMFDNEELLSALILNKFVFKMKDCFNNLLLLEEWIDFMLVIDKCRKVGISEFADIILEKDLPYNEIVAIFNKRFFRLWMDEAMKKFSSIENFRTKNQNELVREFSQYDKVQFKINANRTIAALRANIPNFNSMTVAFDEVGILKRELNKQRKLMPLRKLFSSIPNLLSKMKPCFMMSPLSVSLFLQSDNYEFDLVIFDEASQVKTEDAIGAIIRGKQVIITGDSKQLPPTNFFNSAISDDEYDSEEEETDDGAYDSVLDEAVNFLPERTLRWHYRSRHEHLIAFSNAKIYRHSLITFPAPIEKVDDNGVEYIYVENGVYDRGGKKDNILEAQKIVSIIEHHIITMPNRSMGVVAFSEAQQNCIETLLRKFRLANRQYEDFFREDKEESFFVKNIENVQGDERDTIIFSIGYGKDNKGVMYMNFGPLSKTGGYRRLNVAITRAKYNIKLVGSILPTDIDLDKTSAEGVKMLRGYIDFAIHGKNALENELCIGASQSFDSTFEEAVYDYLSNLGYSVETQVGCSGYRIDLAIKHPNLSGRFVLGVECDGAAYHSSRTARERDRLRQDVLENMGWKIYRIWSTDWIKDPISEGKKLNYYIQECIAKYVDKDANKLHENSSQKELEIEKFSIIKDMVIEKKVENLREYYGFEIYEEIDLSTVNRINYKYSNDYEEALIMKCIELENPINIELLYKKMAPYYGNQKATIKIRGCVDYVLKNRLSSKVVQRDGFCYFIDGKISVKVPDEFEPLRPIEYISQDELILAAITILKKSLGISCKELISLIAKVYRYARTGQNIVENITLAIASLEKEKSIIIVEDKIRINK